MDDIPLFPLHAILFPQADLGIHVFEPRYRSLVRASLATGEGFGVVAIKRGMEVGGPAETHLVGTLARIATHAELPDGRFLLEVEGTRRFRINEHIDDGAYPHALVDWLPEIVGDFGSVRASSDEVGSLFARYQRLCGQPRGDLPASPVARSYAIAGTLAIDLPEKQTLLAAESAQARLDLEREIIRRELALLREIERREG